MEKREEESGGVEGCIGVGCRSLYLPIIRDQLPDVLDLFDFAEPSLVTDDRETTNVPVQRSIS